MSQTKHQAIVCAHCYCVRNCYRRRQSAAVHAQRIPVEPSVNNEGSARRSGQNDVSADEQFYRDISDALVQQALSDLDRDGADDLLARALAVDPGNGDAMYLTALRLRGIQEERIYRRELLRSALGARRVLTPHEDVVAELAELLLAQGRGAEALELLETASHGVSEDLPIFSGVQPVIAATGQPSEQPFNSELSRAERLYVRALLHVGPKWFSAAYLQRLRSRFPADAELAVIDFSRSTRLSLSLLEWIDRETVEGLSVPTELLLHGIVVAKDPEMRQRFARRYNAAGGTDLLGTVAENPAEGVAIAAEHRDKYALERAVVWGGLDGASPLSVLTGENAAIVLLLDADRDQFWEERYYATDGTLRIWEHDTFQDGVVDQRVEVIGEGSTTGLRVLQRDVSDGREHVLSVEYAPYPNVARVSEFSRHLSGEDPRLMVWRPARPITHTLNGTGPWTTVDWNLSTDRVILDFDGDVQISAADSFRRRSKNGRNLR